jgi:cell division protein FtsB
MSNGYTSLSQFVKRLIKIEINGKKDNNKETAMAMNKLKEEIEAMKDKEERLIDMLLERAKIEERLESVKK